MTATTNGMSRGEAMGLYDENGKWIGNEGPDPSAYAKLSARLPDVPDVPGGVSTPKVDEALRAAREAYDAADDILTAKGNYDVLVRSPEELAEAEYRKALAADDPDARYDADRFRARKIEVEAAFTKALRVAQRAVTEAKQVIREEGAELALLSSERLLEAERAYRDTWAAYLAAKARFARIADERAGLLLLSGEDEGSPVVNTASSFRQHPVSRLVTGPAHIEPGEAIPLVKAKLRAHGARGLDPK